METPEKIWINPQMDLPKLNGVIDKDSIEYIRKDVFIEKAYDFIHRKICDYIVHYNYGTNNDMETMYVDSRFFEEFKNYINEN